MGRRLEIKKQLKLTDLAVGKIFEDFELITESEDCDGTINRMTTISQKCNSQEIKQRYYYFYHDNENVTLIETNGYGDINVRDKKYDNSKQKLVEAKLWL